MHPGLFKEGVAHNLFRKTIKNALSLKKNKPSLIKLDLMNYVNKAVKTFTILIKF